MTDLELLDTKLIVSLASLVPDSHVRMHGTYSQDLSFSTVCLPWLDVIREYQGNQLYKEHKMNTLRILRDRVSKSFENQVLAT